MQNKWFKNFKAIPNCKMRMFCFPHAGGTAQDYKKWAMYLPDDAELYAAQLPGRAERITEAFCADFYTLISNLASNILTFINTPYFFVGHSLGGSIAFEVAKAIRKLHYPLPKRLFIIGRNGPNIPENNPTYNLPDEMLIDYLRIQSGTSEKLLEDKDIMQFFLPIVRNDMKLADTYHDLYKKEEPLSCPINVFWGTEETHMKLNELEDWKNETYGTFTIDQFDGHHFFLHNQTEKVISKIFGYIGDLDNIR